MGSGVGCPLVWRKRKKASGSHPIPAAAKRKRSAGVDRSAGGAIAGPRNAAEEAPLHNKFGIPGDGADSTGAQEERNHRVQRLAKCKKGVAKGLRSRFCTVGCERIATAKSARFEPDPSRRPGRQIVLGMTDYKLWPIIGIGGAVTRSPLPHHPPCGSASGGSEGYAWPSKSRGRSRESK
jgi:hypothetical protein